MRLRTFRPWLGVLLMVTPGALAEPTLVVAPGCDQTLDFQATATRRLELPGDGSIDWLQIEQLGIDVAIEAGDRKVDGPTGRWGFESLAPGAGRELWIRALDPAAPPGRIRLRCRSLPADAATRRYFAQRLAAGELPTATSAASGAAFEAYRPLAEAAPAPAIEAGLRLEAAFAAAELAQRQGQAALALPLLELAFHDAERLAAPAWLRADLLNRRGLVLLQLARQDRGLLAGAEADLRQSLALWQTQRQGPEEATACQNLGLLLVQRGQTEEALATFRQGLEALAQLPEPLLRAELHGAAGGALDRLGRLRPALEQYRLALDVARRLDDGGRLEGIQLSNLALSHLALGEWPAALAALDQAAARLRAGGHVALLGSVYNNLGLAYLGLGDGRQAEKTLEAALAVRREIGDRRGELIALNNLGRTRRFLGRLEEARRAHLAALAIAEAIGDPRQQAISRLRLAENSLALGDAGTALEQVAQALDQPGLDGRLRAEMLRVKARGLLLGERLDEAASATAAALEAGRGSDDRLAGIEAELLGAEVARRQGRHEEALAAARAAALDVEAQRETLLTGELRSRFLAAHRGAFAAWIDSALAAGDPGLALEVAERARTRTLLDVLGEAGSLPTPSLAEMQALLDPDTALLEIALGPRESHVWLLTRQGVAVAGLPGEKELDVLVRAAIAEQNVARPGRTATGAAAAPNGARLGRLLLGPFLPRLAGLSRLVVVPDGRFAALAFAALPDPTQPDSGRPDRAWIDRFELVHAPSLAVLARQRALAAAAKPAERFLAVVADPVFSADDPRVSPSPGARPAAAPSFERLPASRREGETILALAGERSHRAFFDFAAAKEIFVGGELESFRYLHVATHGQVDLELAERTGLVLAGVDREGQARDGLLGLPEIYRLNLRAELAVLSSCSSAVGEEIRGEGLISLSRAFLSAGVPKVAATLWPIADPAASRLMPAFYRELWQQGASAPAALRRAQLALRAERRFREPYYWAGFVYFGDWRDTMPASVVDSTFEQEGAIARSLVQRIAGGEAAAERELVERYRRGLAFLLRRSGVPDADLDDFQQETFHTVLERLRHRGLDDAAALVGFIHGTARHLAANERRKLLRRRTDAASDRLDEEAAGGESPLAEVLQQEEARRVRQVIAELPNVRDRQLLLRYYVADDDKERICADLGIDDGHFRRVLYRARERFRELATGRGLGR